MIEVNRDPSRRQVLVTGLVIATACFAVGLVLWRGREPSEWVRPAMGLGIAAAGVIVGAISFASATGGRRVYIGWMTVGAVIGTITTAVLLSGLFFLVLPVFSLVRLKDPLRRRITEGSFWEPHRPHEATLERMSHPF